MQSWPLGCSVNHLGWNLGQAGSRAWERGFAWAHGLRFRGRNIEAMVRVLVTFNLLYEEPLKTTSWPVFNHLLILPFFETSKLNSGLLQDQHWQPFKSTNINKCFLGLLLVPALWHSRIHPTSQFSDPLQERDIIMPISQILKPRLNEAERCAEYPTNTKGLEIVFLDFWSDAHNMRSWFVFFWDTVRSEEKILKLQIVKEESDFKEKGIWWTLMAD